MSWGLQNQLARIIRPSDGHTVMLAADHGYFLGPTHKLEIPRKTLEPLLPFADAVMVTRGVVRTSIDPGASVPIVLRVSGGASVLNEDLSNEKVTTSMKEAVRLNASADALSIFVGAAHEHDSLVNLGKLVDEGEEVGMPVLAVTAVGKELEKRDARYLGLACRIAAEFGAHFVKTYFCEDFSKVVESCPVPLVVAGGPKLETELDALDLAYEAIQEGARGVDMGRNIWQSSNPVGMIRGIRPSPRDQREAWRLSPAAGDLGRRSGLHRTSRLRFPGTASRGIPTRADGPRRRKWRGGSPPCEAREGVGGGPGHCDGSGRISEGGGDEGGRRYRDRWSRRGSCESEASEWWAPRQLRRDLHRRTEGDRPGNVLRRSRRHGPLLRADRAHREGGVAFQHAVARRSHDGLELRCEPWRYSGRDRSPRGASRHRQ